MEVGEEGDYIPIATLYTSHHHLKQVRGGCRVVWRRLARENEKGGKSVDGGMTG